VLALCACNPFLYSFLQPAAPFIDYVLEPLSRRGYFASSTNPELSVTQRMLYSPLTDAVHMTGGTATHDAIVWGGDPAEQARRRAANDPLLKVCLLGFRPCHCSCMAQACLCHPGAFCE
jgi:hypothetical protein